jgi:hypothetical protein
MKKKQIEWLIWNYKVPHTEIKVSKEKKKNKKKKFIGTKP